MPARPLEVGLRLATAIIVLLLLAGALGQETARPLLPLFGREIEGIVPQIRVLTIELGQVGADSVINLHAAPAPIVLIGDRLLPLAPQTRFHVSTPFGHVLQPAILLLAALLAWPSAGLGQWLLRLAAGTPLILLLIAIDVPLVLAAELHASLLELAAPGAPSFLLAWHDFLQAGGRLALAIFTAVPVLTLGKPGPAMPR